jgi:CheY-like chemotaxis protein
MLELPYPLKRVLAAWSGLLAVSGLALCGAAFSQRPELVIVAAVAFLALILVGGVLVSRRIARTVSVSESDQAGPAQSHPSFPVPAGSKLSAGRPSVPDLSPGEQNLRRVQKLEAVERLRDGIVHDLNNKLMVISANIDSVARQMKEQPALQRKLLSALVASDQAAGLLARSTAFARQGDTKVQYVDLAERIDSIAALMSRSLLRDTVELRVDLEDGLWPVEADRDELETAIITLSAYARDTLAQGGAITLEARNIHVQKGTLSDLEREGDFVQLVIGSSGEADPAQDRDLTEQAFVLQDIDLQPWLTLSRSLQFLQPLGGAAEVRNTETGRAIILYLPRANAPALLTSGSAQHDPVESGIVRPHTEILVVDDEVEVALALQSMLEGFGYVTRIATHASQVMKSLDARRPALVLTDVSMPGTLNGMMLAREIRQIFPDLPILLITGNPAVADGEKEFPLLHKPILSRDLHGAIQQHLSKPEENKVVPLFPRPVRRMS